MLDVQSSTFDVHLAGEGFIEVENLAGDEGPGGEL
jgi:hypothetical protein